MAMRWIYKPKIVNLSVPSGGQLSLLIGVKSDGGDVDSVDVVERISNEVAAVVAISPPVDFAVFTEGLQQTPEAQGGAADTEAMEAQALDISPNLFVDAEDPPTLLIHGDADRTVLITHSELMYAELQARRVPSEFVVVPGAGHRIALDAIVDESRGESLSDEVETVREARLEWFNRYLLDDH